MKRLFFLILCVSEIMSAEKSPKLHVMFRDGHYDMDQQNTRALLQCSKLPLIDDGQVLDVSKTYYTRVDLNRLASVIEFSQPIVCLDAQETLNFLDMALDLGAPPDALMTIAKGMYVQVNRQMSPRFSERQIDSKLLTRMSQAAQPYLPGPKTFLEHLQKNEKINVSKFLRRDFSCQVFDLSHSQCIINANYTQQFASLNGLKELLQFIKSKTYVHGSNNRWSLDLSGHYLDSCSLNEIKEALPLGKFIELDLTNNWFYCVCEKEFDTHELPEKLVLAKNRISWISTSVFADIAKARAHAEGNFKFVLNLLDNDETLFADEKRKIESQFNKAVFTIPERFGIYENDGSIFTTQYKLALFATSFIYFCYCIAITQPHDSLTDIQKGILFSQVLGYWYLLSKRIDARLAKYSHFDIDSSRRSDRYIWPKNDSKLLI